MLVKSWSEVCVLINGGENGTQLNYSMGHPGLGVIVSTTYGDGTLPVYLERTATGRRQLVVDLDGEEEEGGET